MAAEGDDGAIVMPVASSTAPRVQLHLAAVIPPATHAVDASADRDASPSRDQVTHVRTARSTRGSDALDRPPAAPSRPPPPWFHADGSDDVGAPAPEESMWELPSSSVMQHWQPGVDFAGDAEAMKSLLLAANTRGVHVSLAVHRVGSVLVVDTGVEGAVAEAFRHGHVTPKLSPAAPPPSRAPPPLSLTNSPHAPRASPPPPSPPTDTLPPLPPSPLVGAESTDAARPVSPPPCALPAASPATTATSPSSPFRTAADLLGLPVPLLTNSAAHPTPPPVHLLRRNSALHADAELQQRLQFMLAADDDVEHGPGPADSVPDGSTPPTATSWSSTPPTDVPLPAVEFVDDFRRPSPSSPPPPVPSVSPASTALPLPLPLPPGPAEGRTVGLTLGEHRLLVGSSRPLRTTRRLLQAPRLMPTHPGAPGDGDTPTADGDGGGGGGGDGGDGGGPVTVNLHMQPAETPFSRLCSLDMWLNNTLTAVPATAVCYHTNGEVAGFSVVPTPHLPSLCDAPAGDGPAAPSPPAFDPAVVTRSAAGLLHFLKDHCVDKDVTYWLTRDTVTGHLRLFQLTAESVAPAPAAATPPPRRASGPLPTFRLPVAMLCLRSAEKLYVTRSQPVPTGSAADDDTLPVGYDADMCKQLYGRAQDLVSPMDAPEVWAWTTLRRASCELEGHMFPSPTTAAPYWPTLGRRKHKRRGRKRLPALQPWLQVQCPQLLDSRGAAAPTLLDEEAIAYDSLQAALAFMMRAFHVLHRFSAAAAPPQPPTGVSGSAGAGDARAAADTGAGTATDGGAAVGGSGAGAGAGAGASGGSGTGAGAGTVAGASAGASAGAGAATSAPSAPFPTATPPPPAMRGVSGAPTALLTASVPHMLRCIRLTAAFAYLTAAKLEVLCHRFSDAVRSLVLAAQACELDAGNPRQQGDAAVVAELCAVATRLLLTVDKAQVSAADAAAMHSAALSSAADADAGVDVAWVRGGLRFATSKPAAVAFDAAVFGHDAVAASDALQSAAAHTPPLVVPTFLRAMLGGGGGAVLLPTDSAVTAAAVAQLCVRALTVNPVPAAASMPPVSTGTASAGLPWVAHCAPWLTQSHDAVAVSLFRQGRVTKCAQRFRQALQTYKTLGLDTGVAHAEWRLCVLEVVRACHAPGSFAAALSDVAATMAVLTAIRGALEQHLELLTRLQARSPSHDATEALMTAAKGPPPLCTLAQLPEPAAVFCPTDAAAASWLGLAVGYHCPHVWAAVSVSIAMLNACMARVLEAHGSAVRAKLAEVVATASQRSVLHSLTIMIPKAWTDAAAMCRVVGDTLGQRRCLHHLGQYHQRAAEGVPAKEARRAVLAAVKPLEEATCGLPPFSGPQEATLFVRARLDLAAVWVYAVCSGATHPELVPTALDSAVEAVVSVAPALSHVPPSDDLHVTVRQMLGKALLELVRATAAPMARTAYQTFLGADKLGTGLSDLLVAVGTVLGTVGVE